jgi:hypothetical protein
MANKKKLGFLILIFVLIAGPAGASQWLPLKTGLWSEMDKQDNLGNRWTSRWDVLEEVTLDGKNYFHVHQTNYDPIEGDVSEDLYIRSTETEVYGWNGPGLGETLGFKKGKVGDYWIYDGGTKRKEIVAIGEISIPYGGTFTAYQYKHYRISNPSRYDLEWVIPGLGLVKEEDHWVSDPGRIPVNGVLARAGQSPLLQLKEGTRMIYNSSDQLGHTWQMQMEVREKVALSNKKIYTHLRQTNYDPFQGNTQEDLYIRCTDKQIFKYTGAGEVLIFQAADKGTKWSHAAQGGTVYSEIVDIAQVTVPYGGPLVAYVQRSYFKPTSSSASPYWYDYVVSGMVSGNVKIVDYWLQNHSRAPVTHVLAEKQQMGDLAPIVNLLLIDE